MTSKEFVIWLKGFTDGVHEYSITPKQWDYLKEKLAEVKDDAPIGFPFGTPNTTPIQTLPHITPSPTNPYRPYEIYCGDTNGTTITTTPNVGGSITIANPNLISFSSGSSTGTVTYINPYKPYTTGPDEKKEKLKKK
jgi:hypothetical protein